MEGLVEGFLGFVVDAQEEGRAELGGGWEVYLVESEAELRLQVLDDHALAHMLSACDCDAH